MTQEAMSKTTVVRRGIPRGWVILGAIVGAWAAAGALIGAVLLLLLALNWMAAFLHPLVAAWLVLALLFTALFCAAAATNPRD